MTDLARVSGLAGEVRSGLEHQRPGRRRGPVHRGRHVPGRPVRVRTPGRRRDRRRLAGPGGHTGRDTFTWRPVAVTDDVAVIEGTTTYPTQTFRNLWVIRLAPDGRCSEFTEWWMEVPSTVD